MDLTGEYRVAAPRDRVWQALNDPAVLQACIAGCQELTRTSDTRFDAVVTTRVGPVSPTFRGTVDLSDIDPPNGYTLTGRGQGGAAGFARMTARVKLEADGDAATVLHYSAQAEVGGKLAAVGSRLIQGVARKTADDFFAAFARQFDPSAPAAAAADDVPAAATGDMPAAAGVGQVPARAAAGAPRAAPVATPAQLHATGLGAPVPAWLLLFCTALGTALGLCIGLLQR